MRQITPTLLVALATPGMAMAATQCSAPAQAMTGPTVQQAPVRSPHLRPLDAAEIASSPALARIAHNGAELWEIDTAAQNHGLMAVFARNGSNFRTFYITPDHEAEIGGIMWDRNGHNLTRAALATVDGLVPTIHWNPKAPPSVQHPASTGAPKPGIDVVQRMSQASYGLYGPDSAPRVYMIVDPLCPYSTRALERLRPYVDSGRLQLALVPISINDWENGRQSTPAAQAMLSSAHGHMQETWQKIIASGHADPAVPPAPEAAAQLALNLNAAHDVGMMGTPTLIWRDSDGVTHNEAGLPDNLDQAITRMKARP